MLSIPARVGVEGRPPVQRQTAAGQLVRFSWSTPAQQAKTGLEEAAGSDASSLLGLPYGMGFKANRTTTR